MLQQHVLLPCRLDDLRMTMPDANRHDSAEGIELALSAFIPDILHLPLHQHERLLVVEEYPGIQELLPLARHLFGRRSAVRAGLMIEEWQSGNGHEENS